jgi:hypothetical protein
MQISNAPSNSGRHQYQQHQSKERIEAITQVYQNMKENRIPQSSIIQSATGNIVNASSKSAGLENEQYSSQQVVQNLGLGNPSSKSQSNLGVVPSGQAKTPTNNGSVQRGLKNPTILDKKQLKASSGISNQNSN